MRRKRKIRGFEQEEGEMDLGREDEMKRSKMHYWEQRDHRLMTAD